MMRIYIKHTTDTDYRFDFGFSDDLEKLEITENTLRVILKDGQDTTFSNPQWEWKIGEEEDEQLTEKARQGKVTEKQKETCAIITMRDAIALLADEEHISYNEAMLKFVGSCVYDALFDFETGIWRESPIYVLELYKRYGANRQKSC